MSQLFETDIAWESVYLETIHILPAISFWKVGEVLGQHLKSFLWKTLS